jgi:hypothetical protein
MNKDRRNRIANIISDLDDILSEEQDAYDNLPESFQQSERGEKMQEAIDYLEEAKSSLEGIE